MTKPNPQSIFQKPDNTYKWDKYLEQLHLIQLSEPERKRAYQSIQFLRSVFGENFLRKGFNNRHPLYFELRNSAPMARLRLIRFAESLQSLKKAEGFDEIIKRLKKVKDTDGFIEASSVLETAYKFHRAGFEIVFEPEIKVTTTSGIKKHKKPDLKLINRKTGEEVFVEVSRLRQSEGQILSGNSFNTIWILIHRAMDDSLVIETNEKKTEQIHRHILPYANILQHLGERDLAEITEKIRILVNRVNKTNEFQELIIKDKIEVAISPVHDHSKAKEWAKQRGMKNLVESPPIPLQETHRARIKIGYKIRQLPQDKPGIIVIPANETLLFYVYETPTITADIRSELEQYPQLKSVILSSQAGETTLSEPIILSRDEDLYIKKTREDLITEQNLLLNNQSFNLQLSKSSVKMITQAFIMN